MVAETTVVEKGLPDGDPIGRNLFTDAFPLPAAVVLRKALEHNLATMRRFCREHGVTLAPHGKTTMFEPIVRRQLGDGAWAMTAATAWQATALAAMGARRILLANQVVDPGSLRLLDDLLRRPYLELHAFVDSPAALDALVRGIAPDNRDRLRVLVELGVPGGRTGIRGDTEAIALARAVAAGPLDLAGVAAFEGIIDGPDLADTLARVDHLLHRVAAVARTVHDERLASVPEPIVTVGGSAYFDRAVAVLKPALDGMPYTIVLRSGCYATHDAGVCHELSPFGARPRAPYQLRDALQIWAPVLSRPEPTLAIAGLGKRDASADAGLPIARLLHNTATGTTTAPAITVTAVNDQHAYLSIPADSGLAVGDVIGFGISHPCTTFDKWRAIPVVDDDHTVVEVGRTYF
ncbi:alanine racemase [Dactylosporangium sp. NPDC050588]|uniref:alanine racemase n=1 Tax=Dactylosporangium sp. NPDC050588 TaxID=3157211 RepID=UPI0033E75471